MVYFLRQEARQGSFFKIGFCRDLEKRLKSYSTANANAECLEFMITYEKTKYSLETALHKELKAKGYKFCRSLITGAETEWIYIPDNKEALAFEQAGLAQFKASKGRKIYPYEKPEA